MSSISCTTTIVGTAEQDAKLRKQIADLKGENSLVQILQAAQDIYGYLPEKVINLVAYELDVSSETVYSVATFYSQFNFSPKGKYAVSVCLGTACYVKGAGEIYEKLKEKLNLGDGETSSDGKFSLDACRCMGACGLAPVMSINETVYGNVTVDALDAILSECK